MSNTGILWCVCVLNLAFKSDGLVLYRDTTDLRLRMYLRQWQARGVDFSCRLRYCRSAGHGHLASSASCSWVGCCYAGAHRCYSVRVRACM